MIREKLISAGIRNLKEFGYPAVNEQNIITDLVYGQFFDSMLKDNLGHGLDKEINGLRSEIAEAQKQSEIAEAQKTKSTKTKTRKRRAKRL